MQQVMPMSFIHMYFDRASTILVDLMYLDLVHEFRYRRFGTYSCMRVSYRIEQGKGG